MDKPSLKDSRGMIVDGIFSSEAIDSSGEVVKLDGIDISSMEEGTSVANYEHKKPEEGGAQVADVGRIIYVHKVFKQADCEDDRQRFFWKKAGQPFLYGMVRLYDEAGHDQARALAAQIRDAVYHDSEVAVRFSVEGTTLERDSNVVKSSIARKVALTVGPCNRTCNSGIVQDTNAPEGYDKHPELKKNELLGDPTNTSIGNAPEYIYNPIVSDPGENSLVKLVKALQLIKATTVGSCDAAPSALSGGAVLQREEIGDTYKGHIVDAIKSYKKSWDRKEFKNHLRDHLHKANLPDVSDTFLDHFMGVAQDYQIKKNIDLNKSLIINKSLVGTLVHLEGFLLDLQKALKDELGGANIQLPEIYLVQMKVGGALIPAGRFMVANGNVYHLEDYHNVLGTMVPEGPIGFDAQTGIGALRMTPEFLVTEHQIPSPISETAPGLSQISSSKIQAPERPTVFEYWRPGMVQPHTIEFTDHGAALDGEGLSQDELSLILNNIESGAATLKWKSSQEDLAKAEPSIHEAMAAMRAAVQAGHISPEHEKAFTQFIYEDHMIPGIGNKFAFNNFLDSKKPGVYGSIDLNSFKHINDTHGHIVGDSTIKAVGKALREAADTVGTGKLHRPGGDEFHYYAPHEADMHKFMRAARESFSKIPSVGGVHKPSFSIGLGADYETADKALREAKKQKVDPVSGKALYHPARTPHLAHSLLPGSEGPIDIGGLKDPSVKSAA